MTTRVWLPRLAELRADSLLAFEALDGRRRIVRRGEAVLAGLPADGECELVLHPFDAVLLDVKVPKLTGARLGAALPGMVEERIAGDIDLVHVAATERDAQGEATAAIVDRALLRRALDLFARAGRRVRSATPQPLALPVAPGHWVVRAEAGAGAVRWGARHGTSLGIAASTPPELALLMRQAGRPSAITVVGDIDHAAWSEALGVPVRPADIAIEAPPIVLELLQYALAPRLAVDKSWRTTIALACALALVGLAGLNLHAARLRSEERALRDDMNRLVRETFPEVPVVLDPVAQMRRLVADLRPGSNPGGFVPLAAGIAHLLPPDSLQRMEYRDSVLTVTLRPESAMNDAQRSTLIGRGAEDGFVVTFAGTSVRLSRKEAP